MATISVRGLKWRDGRPRWEPSPRLRKAGWKGQDLKTAAGDWMDLGAAIAAAEVINADVDHWAATGARRQRDPVSTKSDRTGRLLWEMYEASPRFAARAAATQADYRVKARAWLTEYGEIAVAAIEHADLYSWWEELHATRGHAMANGIVAVARLLLSYAVKKGWRRDNPARSLGLETLPPRCVVFTPSEIAALVETADAIGLPGVGDAVVLGLHTGQRQADVLACEAPQTANGWSLFRQRKTAARVRIPNTDQLAARLAQIAARRRAGAIVAIGDAAGPLVRRPDGTPYRDRSQFGKDWRRVRDEASSRLADCAARESARRIGGEMALSEKQFLDLRDTAVTRLALAGCTVAEIRAITGHKMETIHQVLQHYLALDDRMALAGIERLRAWMREEGIAL